MHTMYYCRFSLALILGGIINWFALHIISTLAISMTNQ